MELPTRYYLQVPKPTIVLSIFALVNLVALSGYLWITGPVLIPQYLFFILSFAGFYVGFSIFKIIWWNVLNKGWLEISANEISFTKFFRTTTIKTDDIYDINIPGLDENATLSDCINISVLTAQLQSPLQLIIPLVFFQSEDQELLPLVLNSVTK